ncbi:hypothetical protein AK88_01964 [Plasmodium fragile]|uniref:Uncharacterized protein n=1 Tax=Plasmodium fragile TaxID=5857 RepID=A0A0D9QN45_PLAFR|nr:uncharacterized protein AK88_01964 [Plasmodium fragile]KJP88348.1 hypothetical protein AK88_01964 [Plasmodium fragile]
MDTTNNLNELHSAGGVGYINTYDVEHNASVPNLEASKRQYLPISSPNVQVFHSLNFENGMYMNAGEGHVVGGLHMMNQSMVLPSAAGVDIPMGDTPVTNSPIGNHTDAPSEGRPVDTPHTVDALFSTNKYKVKKIKETHSISADYTQKKNLTSILPFEKIMEEYEIQSLYPQSKVQELYNHQNMYEEKGRYNLMPPNGHVANGTMRKDFTADSSDASPSPYLSQGNTPMYGAQYACGAGVESSNFGGANGAKDRHIGQMGYAANRVTPGSPLQVEHNTTATGHPPNKAIQTDIKNINEKDKAGTPPHNDWEQNEQCTQNNLLEMYDHKQNKKVIYYAVKNHYDPTKEMHKKEKTNYPPNRHKVYQNDIYDYLLHHYEKNYKHILDSKYLDQSVFKGDQKEFLASQANPHTTSPNGTYIAGGILNTKENYDNAGDEDNSKGKNTNAMPRSNEEANQSNLGQVTMSDNLKGTHLCRKDNYSVDVNGVQDVTPLNGRQDNVYQTSVEISNLCDEDAMDLYKNISEVYTPRPKLFVYAVKGNAEGDRRYMEGSPIDDVLPKMDTPLGELPLQINKEMKKIFKRMKHKNTVVISNLGVRTGSSTFSNHILKSGHERGFFGGSADHKNCVYAHVMASPNKINYVYLHYKLVLAGGRSKSADKVKRDDKLKRDDRIKRHSSRSVGRSSCGDGDVPSEVNTLIALSFYLSNIIIFHINSESCSKVFDLLAQYYDVVKHIKENVKRRRDKCEQQDRGKDVGGDSKSGNSGHRNSFSQSGASLPDTPHSKGGNYNGGNYNGGNYNGGNYNGGNYNGGNYNGGNYNGGNGGEDNSEEDNFEEDNFSVPYFVFLLRDTTLGSASGADIGDTEGPSKLPPRKSLTKEAESKKVPPKVTRNSAPNVVPPTGDNQSARAQKLLEDLIEGIQNPVIKKKVKYLLKFLAKKSLFHLPPLKEKNKEEYAIQMRKIKKDIFINGKNVEYMYPNNGIYVYKYLNMLTYTINRNIFYTPNYLKKKMESCECKTLHNVLTDNFLFHVRRKIENKLPMKPNLFLTLINDIKIEFLLSFETLCIGNSKLKRKYKNQLCHNIDVIVLKAYKENIAFSCFIFFNIIDKKISKLQIYNKINKRKYEHFDQLRNDIDNINDGSIDNLIYNEILGIKKEEILTYFIKTYYSGFTSRKGSSFVRVQQENDAQSQHEYNTHTGAGYTKATKKNSYNSDSTVDPDQFADPCGHQTSRRSVSGARVLRMNTTASSALLRRGSRHHSEKAFSKGQSHSSSDQHSHNYDTPKQIKGNKYKSDGHSLRGKNSSCESSVSSHHQKGGPKDPTDGRRTKHYTDEEDKGKKTHTKKPLHKFKSDVELQNERKIKMIQEIQLGDRHISKKYHSVDYKNALPASVHQNEISDSNSYEPSYHGGAALQTKATPQHAGVQSWPNTTERIKKQEKQHQKKR